MHLITLSVEFEFEFQTSIHIERFNLHDSPVLEIAMSGDAASLLLEFAHINADHPTNSFDIAQCIKPCLICLQHVSAQSARIWCDTTRQFVTHPDPDKPIDGDIVEFACEQTLSGLSIKFAGFYGSEWVEWLLECESATVMWAQFTGPAWYAR